MELHRLTDALHAEVSRHYQGVTTASGGCDRFDFFCGGERVFSLSKEKGRFVCSSLVEGREAMTAAVNENRPLDKAAASLATRCALPALSQWVADTPVREKRAAEAAEKARQIGRLREALGLPAPSDRDSMVGTIGPVYFRAQVSHSAVTLEMRHLHPDLAMEVVALVRARTALDPAGRTPR